jgi:hypothetical protein
VGSTTTARLGLPQDALMASLGARAEAAEAEVLRLRGDHQSRGGGGGGADAVSDEAGAREGAGERGRSAAATYGDEKVANRDIRVWHGATEKGP